MKKKRWIPLLIPCLWCLLVLLLTLAERQSPTASIKTVGDALWYSLVTLTTVGYGDLFPVTFWGKIIGGIFVLLSVGLVAAIFGFIVVLLTGRALPKLQLWTNRGKQWNVFVGPSKEAVVLAADLNGDKQLNIFIGTKEHWPEEENAVYFDGTADEVLRYQNSSCRLFFFGEDETQNYRLAVQYGDEKHPAYAACSHYIENLPSYVTLFDKTEACARLYWSDFPLRQEEKTVVVIGCQNYGGALLEHGLASGVRGSKLPVHWHVFGDHAAWRTAHYQLMNNLQLAGFDTNADSLTFHNGEWNTDPQLILNADRIILCADSDEENARLVKTVRRLYPTCAKLHVRMNDHFANETVFGTQSQLLSKKYVIQNRLVATAMAMHNIYRAGADYPVETWQELTDFKQRSNIAAADHIPVKLAILLDDEHTAVNAQNCRLAYEAFVASSESDASYYREIEHTRWNRFHLLNNWRYDPVRNDELCRHPMLLPFDKLTLSEQQKDDYAWKLLEQLAEISRKEEV